MFLLLLFCFVNVFFCVCKYVFVVSISVPFPNVLFQKKNPWLGLFCCCFLIIFLRISKDDYDAIFKKGSKHFLQICSLYFYGLFFHLI